MFRNVIVRRPSRSMIEGITTADLGLPDYDLALRQHDQYIQAMEACGAKVTVLPAMEEYPDSCFVEDVAVVTPKCAIITNPGAPSRNGEKAYIVEAVYDAFCRKFERLNREYGLKQYVVPYLISSHPGSTMKEAVDLAEAVRDMGYETIQIDTSEYRKIDGGPSCLSLRF